MTANPEHRQRIPDARSRTAKAKGLSRDRFRREFRSFVERQRALFQENTAGRPSTGGELADSAQDSALPASAQPVKSSSFSPTPEPALAGADESARKPPPDRPNQSTDLLVVGEVPRLDDPCPSLSEKACLDGSRRIANQCSMEIQLWSTVTCTIPSGIALCGLRSRSRWKDFRAWLAC